MFNVTLIYSDGSPCTFQCLDSAEVMRRVKETCERRANSGERTVHCGYVYNTNAKQLSELEVRRDGTIRVTHVLARSPK